MENQLKISVIIPTYNRSDVILRSLETWHNQSVSKSDFEVIVMDNNSTDGADVLIKDFIKDKPNFKYVLEKEKGSTNARHAGAKMAKADILMFCDDDGLFNSNCVKEILKVYEINPEVCAVTGKISIQWDKTPPTWIMPYLFMLGQLDYGNDVKFSSDFYLNGGIFSIKKGIFHELGGFNPDLIGNYLVGDGDTGLVIKLHKNKMLIGYTPFATMQHLQFVEKQGTEKDMGRRFYNVGISESYGFFRENNFKFTFSVVKYILSSFIFGTKKHIEYIVTKKRKSYFSWMQRRGELCFLLQFEIKGNKKRDFFG